MSINRFDAFDATSVVTPAVMRFVAGFVGAIVPKVNCVIFESEPVGVVDVSAVALAAMSVRTMMSGIDSAPMNGSTSNQSQFNQMIAADAIGMPITLQRTGNSMSRRQSSVFSFFAKMPVNALRIIFGFAKSPTIDAVTIIETPHPKHQLLVRCGRPKIASDMA